LIKIEYYEENGKIPVMEFLKSLKPKEIAKILRDIDLLEKYGLFLGGNFLKRIVGTKNLWELRTRLGSNSFRILHFSAEKEKIVLLNGFKKKTRKTPKKEIEIAKQRIKKYYRRAKNES